TADLDRAANESGMNLLLDLALTESPEAVADAARLFEYFDFSVRPARKLGALLSLLFTSRAHLEQLYGSLEHGGVYFNYLRRPFGLVKKLNRESLSPATLWRVWRLRRLSVHDRPDERGRMNAE